MKSCLSQMRGKRVIARRCALEIGHEKIDCLRAIGRVLAIEKGGLELACRAVDTRVVTFVEALRRLNWRNEDG